VGHETTITNGYALSVNGGTGSTLTYDLDGNMTSDGTNTFLWDAENRMIKITYPGTNNFSSFVYDGMGRNVSIVETTAGSVTSTKQFVWAKDKKRKYQPCEERDSSGAVTKQFFVLGQMNSSTKYFYGLNHHNSVVGMTDNSGSKVAEYGYDPYGRVTKISETVAADFAYAGYYLHSRSGLNLTRARAYSSTLGRWINRDPIGEEGGINLYDYVANDPIFSADPSGLGAPPLAPPVAPPAPPPVVPEIPVTPVTVVIFVAGIGFVTGVIIGGTVIYPVITQWVGVDPMYNQFYEDQESCREAADIWYRVCLRVARKGTTNPGRACSNVFDCRKRYLQWLNYCDSLGPSPF